MYVPYLIPSSPPGQVSSNTNIEHVFWETLLSQVATTRGADAWSPGGGRSWAQQQRDEEVMQI